MWGRFTNYDGEVPTIVCHTLWMVWLLGGSIAEDLHGWVGLEMMIVMVALERVYTIGCAVTYNSIGCGL